MPNVFRIVLGSAARHAVVVLLGAAVSPVRAAETSAPPIAAETAGLVFSHQEIYARDPKQPILQPTEAEIELQQLDRINRIEEEEFTAPPLIVARISSLPAGEGAGGPTQALARAERNLIRERARASDRLFNRGQHEAAIELMLSTERILKTVNLRAIALNRLAAYHFRLQQYDETALYARRAWELNPLDFASACNVAATLLTVGQVDEALDILLRMYGRAFNHRNLAFSVHFNLACAYSLKGEPTKALQNLALAAQLDPVSTYTVIGDPHLDPIRSAPEFIRMRERLGQLLQRAKTE